MANLHLFFCRYILEKFFLRVKDVFDENETVKEAIKKHASPKDIQEIRKSFPKMTTINRILENEFCRQAVWQAMGLNSSVPLPSLHNNLLYGTLSDAVHSPGMRTVYLAKESDKSLVVFFSEVSVLFKTDITFFNMDMALAGRDLL